MTDKTPKTHNLRIAFWQSNAVVGDIAGNISRLVAVAESLAGKADLLVTPECYGTGYPIQDLALRPGFIARFRKAIESLSERVSRGDIPAILIGGPEEGPDLPHNAMFLIDRDGSIKTTRKHHLANSEVYDEVRTFAPGPLPVPVTFRGMRLGIAICEDIWHGDVARALEAEGADIIICPNGSHFKASKQERRRRIGRRTTGSTKLPFVYVNLVGGQDEIVFDGGSFVMDAQGHIIHEAGFEENLFITEMMSDRISMCSEKGAEPHDSWANGYPRTYEERMYSASVLGLRDYVNKCGFPGVVIGMSGGVDSALTAAMAVDALGPERVLLVRLPAQWTSSRSMEDAEIAADLLRARIITIPVGDAVKALEACIAVEAEVKGVTAENLQSRARGMVLMGLSNATRLMVLSTGNKSEMTVGYATLYGDMCGGFNALKDIWKTDVFRLCRWRNTGSIKGMMGPGGTVVPESILARPPSAELAPDQTDENSLGSYEDLDTILKLVIEQGMGAAEAAREGSILTGHEISEEYAQRMVRMTARAEWKRRQAPPGLVLGDNDFSKGWRLPLVNHGGL